MSFTLTKQRKKLVLPFLNNPKDLDPSYKTDLDILNYFESKKLCLRNMI